MDTLEPLAAAAPKLVPPRVAIPAAPLPMWRFIPAFIRNPLSTLPQSVYEERFVYRDGARTMYITAPDLVERLLLTEATSVGKTPLERRIFEQSLGDGILSSDGPSWKWQRRTAAPVFRHADLIALVPAMVAAADDLVAEWRAAPAGDVRAVDQDMEAVTFKIISSTIFAGAADSEGDTIRHNSDIMLDNVPWRILAGIFGAPKWLWHPGKATSSRAAAETRATVGAILARRRARGTDGADITARLMQARDPETGAPMSDEQLIDNLLTFLAAGHETTAKALTWTLYLLSRAPEWQDLVRAEVAAVAGSASLGASDLDRLVVTRQVVKEAMRLYPPAPMMSRAILAPFRVDGIDLPLGTRVIVPIYAIHRHRKLWDDPDTFDPERFAPAREATYARTQFMPFGFGQRICIGMSFAMMEAVLLLATFVRGARFDWDGTHLPEPISRVTLRPDGGMPLSVTALPVG